MACFIFGLTKQGAKTAAFLAPHPFHAKITVVSLEISLDLAALRSPDIAACWLNLAGALMIVRPTFANVAPNRSFAPGIRDTTNKWQDISEIRDDAYAKARLI